MFTGKAAVIDNKRLLTFSCIKISNGTLVMFDQRFEGIYLSLTKVIHTDANEILRGGVSLVPISNVS